MWKKEIREKRWCEPSLFSYRLGNNGRVGEYSLSLLNIFLLMATDTSVQLIVRPKGVNARPAILKCCLAKGMPIIVM